MRQIAISSILTIIFICGSAAPSSSQPKAENGNSRSLTLTMSPINQRVLLLEPIALKFGLENKTAKPLSLREGLSLHTIKLSIKKPNGEVFVANQLSGLSGPRSLAGRRKVVAPGQSGNWIELLEYKLYRYFGEAGEYRINAQYDNGDSVLSTGWVALIVERPSSENQAAYQFLSKFKGVDSGVFTLATSANRAEFLGKFPNTPYSDYVRYFTAKSHVGKDNEKAKMHFRMLEGKLNFALVDDVKKELQAMSPKESNE